MTTESPTREIVLHAGDFHFGGGHTRIATLLGSCVSITFWHPQRRIGGMCHYMLAGRQRAPDALPDGHYADEAFELFLQHARANGTQLADYQAKIFGGGNMYLDRGNGMAIGAGNINRARQLLSQHGVVLHSEHVGGSGRRKLYFDLWSGDVWLSFPQGSGAQVRNRNKETHG